MRYFKERKEDYFLCLFFLQRKSFPPHRSKIIRRRWCGWKEATPIRDALRPGACEHAQMKHLLSLEMASRCNQMQWVWALCCCSLEWRPFEKKRGTSSLILLCDCAITPPCSIDRSCPLLHPYYSPFSHTQLLSPFFPHSFFIHLFSFLFNY